MHGGLAGVCATGATLLSCALLATSSAHLSLAKTPKLWVHVPYRWYIPENRINVNTDQTLKAHKTTSKEKKRKRKRQSERESVGTLHRTAGRSPPGGGLRTSLIRLDHPAPPPIHAPRSHHSLFVCTLVSSECVRARVPPSSHCPESR